MIQSHFDTYYRYSSLAVNIMFHSTINKCLVPTWYFIISKRYQEKTKL